MQSQKKVSAAQAAAQALIDQSIYHGTATCVEYSRDIAAALFMLSEDNVEQDYVVEYWGTTVAGAMWRVRLDFTKEGDI